MADIDSLEYWYDQLQGRSKSTRVVYKLYFRQFCEFSGKGPNELIELQRRALASNGDPRENHMVENLVRQWLVSMKESKSAATRQMGLSSVKSFFELNEHPLRMKRMDRPRGESVGSRIPTKEEVIRVADVGKWKYRAAVMFLKDSGLRISDVVRVRWEDKADMGDGFWNFNLLTQKRQVKACAFVGPETTRLLTQFKDKQGRIFKTTRDNMKHQLSRLIHTAEIEGVTAHGLRKYFNTQLQHARVLEEYRLKMMGKKVSVYSETRREELFQEYKRAYPELSLYAQQNQTEEIEALKKKVNELMEAREQEDQILGRIESQMRIAGGREFYDKITKNVFKVLTEMQEQRDEEKVTSQGS